jgi:hypothetical protein
LKGLDWRVDKHCLQHFDLGYEQDFWNDSHMNMLPYYWALEATFSFFLVYNKALGWGPSVVDHPYDAWLDGVFFLSCLKRLESFRFWPFMIA